MICISCTFHYSVWSFHLSFCYKFWDVWHQLICWFNVSWTLSSPDVVNVLQSILLMSLHVVLPHSSLFRCTCSDCCSFCYHLRVGLSPVFECLLHRLWLPLVLVLSYSCDWLICQCFKLLTPTILHLLPLSRLVIFVSIPLHDGCISCRLYNMYLLFLCTDLCPLLR
jgi:hypothetical protein